MKVYPTSDMSINVNKLIGLAESWLDMKTAPYLKEADQKGLPQLSVNVTNNSRLPECILELMPKQVLRKLYIPFRSTNDFKMQFPYFILTKDGEVKFYPDLKTLNAKHPAQSTIQGHLSANPNANDSYKVIIAFLENIDPRELTGN